MKDLTCLEKYRWFLTYESAEEELLSRYTDDYELVGYDSKWYEVRRL